MKTKLFENVSGNQFRVNNEIEQNVPEKTYLHDEKFNGKIQQIESGKDDIKIIEFSKMISHQPQITFNSGEQWLIDWNEFIKFIGLYGKLIGKI